MQRSSGQITVAPAVEQIVLGIECSGAEQQILEVSGRFPAIWSGTGAVVRAYAQGPGWSSLCGQFQIGATDSSVLALRVASRLARRFALTLQGSGVPLAAAGVLEARTYPGALEVAAPGGREQAFDAAGTFTVSMGERLEQLDVAAGAATDVSIGGDGLPTLPAGADWSWRPENRLGELVIQVAGDPQWWFVSTSGIR